MISPDKIDEWIREVQDRPESAELIIRYIANRLCELASREEELSAENIALLSGNKVEEYENRIASLEYQLELLKRQLGGEVVLPSDVPMVKPIPEMSNVLVYNPLGQVLRLEMNPAELASGKTLAQIQTGALAPDLPLSLLVAGAQEELLFVFDSGRSAAMPMTKLPANDADKLEWQHAFLQEPRIREELAAIQPIAKMTLYETCIQASRRGFVKKMKTSFLAAHMTENYIGSGVKMPADKTWGLTLANNNDRYVLVSQEGYIFSMGVDKLPIAIEEVIRLGITDHIVTAFVTGEKTSLLFITQNGKAVHRETGWLEGASSFKTKGQALLSKERREAGIRIIGAVPVGELEWGVFLHRDGSISVHQLSELIATGIVPLPGDTITLLAFASFIKLEAGVETKRKRSALGG